jgi:prepilin-type N-terminal cleavage/methylation domain-containing protein
MKRGFTIVEILVVVGVILILMALIFPVFGGAVRRTYETRCLSNMKQIYLAAQLYTEDNGGPPFNSVLLPCWRPYLPESIAYQCQAAQIKDKGDRTISGDYLVQFNPSRMDEGYGRCAEIRGTAFPVVLDLNHLNTRIARKAGRRVLLLVRSSGSAHTIMASGIDAFFRDKSSFPCPFLDSPYVNQ